MEVMDYYQRSLEIQKATTTLVDYHDDLNQTLVKMGVVYLKELKRSRRLTTTEGVSETSSRGTILEGSARLGSACSVPMENNHHYGERVIREASRGCSYHVWNPRLFPKSDSLNDDGRQMPWLRSLVSRCNIPQDYDNQWHQICEDLDNFIVGHWDDMSLVAVVGLGTLGVGSLWSPWGAVKMAYFFKILIWL